MAGPPRSPGARLLVALVDVALVVALTAASAELLIRWAKPLPRAQVVRDAAFHGHTGFRLAEVGGEWTWREVGSDARSPPCGPDDTVVELFGSSILFGIDLRAEDTVGPHLRERLEQGGGSWCVQNRAEPGFVSGQKRAVAEAVLPEAHPDVVVWEIWSNDPGRYVRIGHSVYNVAPYVVDEDDVPWLPVPAALHHALFTRSTAWEYLTLALAPTDPGWELKAWRERTLPDLAAVHALAEAEGARMIVVLMAHLDRPFSTSTLQDAPGHPYALAVAEAERLGIPHVEIAEAWADVDPRTIALDDVHLNPAGHERLAELLAPKVRALAAGEATASIP